MRTGPRSTVRHRVPRPWDPDPRGLQPDVASVDPRPARGFIASPGMGGRGPGFHHRPATPPPRCLLSAGVRRGFAAGPANCGSGQHPDPAVRAPVRRPGSPDSAPAARRNRRVSRPADHGGCRHRASDRPAAGSTSCKRAIRTSGARYRRDGWLRRSLRNLFCLALWLGGTSPERIRRFYETADREAAARRWQ